MTPDALPPPATARCRLLITCDDLGYHPTINQAIVELLAGGLVRATSIMPAAPHFADAVARLRDAGVHGVGVHLTLTSEYAHLPVRALTDRRRVASLVSADGRFRRSVAAGDGLVVAEAAAEWRAQIERVRACGLRPTHLDGHMFCYEPSVGGAALFAAARELAAECALPLRVRALPGVALPAARRVYMRWQRDDSAAARTAYYTTLLATYADDCAELIIHPGADSAAMAAFSATGANRRGDYEFFSSAAFRRLVAARGIEIVGSEALRPVT